VVRLAERQGGAITRTQAIEHGLRDDVIGRLVAEGTWRRSARGVYALSGRSWWQDLWTGLLIGGPEAVLGLAAAAHLNGFEDRPETIAIFIGEGANRRGSGPWRFIRGRRLGMGWPHRTSPLQTVLDLARGATPDDLAALVARGVSSGRVCAAALLERIEDTPRVPQRALLLDIVRDVDAGAESALEVRYVRDVERRHRLPRASRQVRLGGRYRTDALYEEYRVIAELDGWAYHRGAAAARDLTRDNTHRLQGYVTLRFTWGHVAGDPCGVARDVAAALAAGGWTGELQPCPRCAVQQP
jgi:very-short-patch-repair endonuclease